jgi:hypothetical protein
MCCDLEADLSFVKLAVLTANVIEFLKEKHVSKDHPAHDDAGKREHDQSEEARAQVVEVVGFVDDAWQLAV